ncbi:TPA: hypothetical protein L4U31_002855 [Pseudomonas aeruginosa]|nr:hypothetical protein [Pseudomonas aeruginosa]
MSRFAPLDTSLVEQRLRDQVAEIEEVLGAADYAQVRDLNGYRLNTAYVVLAAERNPAGAGPQAQRATAAEAVFGVVICTRNYRDPVAAGAKDDATRISGAVREALIGWAPRGWKTCIWLQGQVLDSDQNRVLWLDVFTTTHVLGGTP